MKYPTIAALMLALSQANAYDVISLNPENFDELTDGKTVFLKFFAPWCGYCKQIAPDWEALAEAWDGSDIGLVAEVDCTDEGEQLCEQNNVQGFPTLKYGDPTDLWEYEGGRDLEDLLEFAKANLVPLCSPTRLDLCDDEKKEKIASYMAMSDEDINSKIQVELNKISEADAKFDAEVEALEQRFEQVDAEREAIIAEVNQGDLGIMKKVMKAKEAEQGGSEQGGEL